MSPTLANFLFDAANFLVLASAIGWFMFKPVRAALESERDRRAGEEARLEKMNQDAESLLHQAQEAHQSLAEELREERAALLADARKEAAEIKDKARTEQLEEKRALEKKRQAEKRAQAQALADTVGRIGAASVRGFLDALAGPSLDSALLEAVCTELSAIPSETRGRCTVESARPLDEASRERLRDAIGDSFVERTVSELGAGVRVTTEVGQIDGSAVNLARQAARQVSAAVSDLTGAEGVAP